MSGKNFLDGKVTLLRGDSSELIKGLPENSIDAVVCDPPYALVSIVKRFGGANAAPAKGNEAYARASAGFMGKTWDTGEVAFSEAFWADVLRVLKPGGHLVAFSGTRTYHRMACAIEDAGFEIRDQIGWAYGSGFPKSHDVSKGIDKGAVPPEALVRFQAALVEARTSAGMSRADVSEQVVGSKSGACWNWESGLRVPTGENWNKLVAVLSLPPEFQSMRDEAERAVIGRGNAGLGKGRPAHEGGYAPEFDITAPATDAAKQWQGWGTALKPAWEPICLARKPFAKGMTVAANVLEHGVGALNIDGCRVGTDWSDRPDSWKRSGHSANPDADKIAAPPGNGINCHNLGRWPANIIHDGSEEVVAAFPAEAGGAGGHIVTRTKPKFGDVFQPYDGTEAQKGNGFADSGSAARFFYTAKADADDSLGSKHPTVKPLDLMQWLVRLVTPKGGMVLDPFAGTGTTGEAAWREGMRAILMEREPEYQEDIARRMDLAVQPTKRAAVAASKNNLEKAEDLPLFALLAE
jgi:DNA modification methylase